MSRQKSEIIEKNAEKLFELSHLSRDLVSIADLDTLLKRIMEAIKEICGTEASSVLLLDEERGELYFREAAGEKGEIIKQIRVPLNDSKSIAGWCATNRKSIIVNDAQKDPRHSKTTDEISGFLTRSVLAVPALWQDRLLGVIEAVNKIGGNFTDEDEMLLNLLASHVAVALNTTRLIGDLRNFFVHSVDIFIQLMDDTFPALKGHSSRVARIAAGIGREIGLGKKEYEDLFYAAYLHDIGKLKLALPTLNDTTHPVVACRMLEPIRLFKDILPLIRHHHERYDGTGFPDRLKGDAIPLGARILAIAEDFDEQGTMISGLVAQRGFYDQFLKGFGERYDPQLLEPFRKVLGNAPVLIS